MKCYGRFTIILQYIVTILLSFRNFSVTLITEKGNTDSEPQSERSTNMTTLAKLTPTLLGAFVGCIAISGAAQAATDASLDPQLKKPTPIVKVAPKYPLEQRMAAKDGKVIVEAILDESGNLGDVTVVESTSRGFERNTLAALKEWKFTPALYNGEAIPVRVRIPFRFEITMPAKGIVIPGPTEPITVSLLK